MTPAPRIRQETDTVKRRKYARFVVHYGIDDTGRRIRRVFKTLDEAEAHIEKQAKLQVRIGRQARKLKDADLRDAAFALDILRGSATSVRAAEHCIQHNDPSPKISELRATKSTRPVVWYVGV